jgi:hypothetical protein
MPKDPSDNAAISGSNPMLKGKGATSPGGKQSGGKDTAKEVADAVRRKINKVLGKPGTVK